MPPERDTLADELLRQARSAQEKARALAARAGAAHEAAAAHAARARRLAAFVAHFRDRPDELPVRCAWCGRVEVAGEFVAHGDFLEGDLPERIVERASHGICPDCFEREQRRADEARGG